MVMVLSFKLFAIKEEAKIGKSLGACCFADDIILVDDTGEGMSFKADWIEVDFEIWII